METLPRDTKGPSGEREEDDGGWSTVQRKGSRQSNTGGHGEPVTSFYVSNLPNGANKAKIRLSFIQFGKVVDVYIGGKRDRSGSIFAFVRFANVGDVKALELEMSKVRYEHCIIRVNIAKYHKQSGNAQFKTARPAPPPINRQAPPNRIPINRVGQQAYTHRTYANAVTGSRHQQRAIETGITEIKPATHSKDWENCVMVGEPISLQHTADLPTLLPLDGNPCGKLYYIGGLNVLIKFTNNATAKSFYNNEHNWNRWFKWLKMGFNDDLPQERLAWVTVFGLPVRFRSVENYEHIASRFGKVIQSEIHDWTQYDLSDGNICINTKQNTIINEEIKVVFNNNIYRIGVVEFDRDWKPYDHIPNNPLDSDDDEEDDEDANNENHDEGFEDADEEIEDSFDSDSDDNNRKKEEPEDDEMIEESDEDESPTSESIPETLMDADDPGNQNPKLIAEVDSSPITIETAPIEVNDTETRSRLPQPTVTIDSPCNPNASTFEPTKCSGPASIPLPDGDEWPKTPNASPKQTHADIQHPPEFGKGSLFDKRRRYTKLGCSFKLAQSLQPISYPWEINVNHRPPATAPQFGNFDLNHPAQSTASSGCSKSEESESSGEYSSLLKIGNSIGFQLLENDPVAIEIGYGFPMNCLSLNIRGCGESHKIEWLQRIKNTQKPDVICLQETRVADSSTINFKQAWGNDQFDMEFVNPTGRSGGIITLWDPYLFSKSNTISSRNYIVITGNWKGIPNQITIANVYGPQSRQDKKKIWFELLEIKRNTPGIWIALGDFNAVRYANERINSTFCRRIAKDFNDFILKARLQEFNTGGSKFTYMCDYGLKLSKLDRILVCSNFILQQPLSTVLVLDREYSDHSPIILKPSNYDFGLPSFRFFNSWLLKYSFNEEFLAAWNSFKGFGSPNMFLKSKLKFVKNRIRNWKKADSIEESKILKSTKSKILEIEKDAESRNLSEAEISERRECKNKISELDRMAKLDLQQKAKINGLPTVMKTQPSFTAWSKAKTEKTDYTDC
ncbi:hypothetical protein LXL04_005050 [Taraxacum kok-saghyz]